MSMVQAYRGYFKQDKFIPLEEPTNKIKIPEDVEVFITITGRALSKKPAISSKETDISKRREIVKSLRGCMAGYDIDLKQAREERLKARGLL